MKLTIKNIPAAAGVMLLAISLWSCTKGFLDVKPKGKVIAGNIADYNNMLEDVLFNRLTGNGFFLNTQHIAGDDVAGLEPYFSNPSTFSAPANRGQNLFAWADNVYRPDEDCNEIAGLYNRLYSINKIFHEVMDASGGTLQQKEQYQAEARTQRGFAYFMLINYFGKPYNAATAATDPGVPIVLQSDFTQTSFVRASVQEVYDQIIDDLTSAIPKLPLVQTDANRFTRAGATALLGKVYLFMGNATRADALLDDAITQLPAAFTVSGKVGLIDYNTAKVNNPITGYIFTTPDMVPTPAQGHGYPETLVAQSVAITWMGASSALVISPETYALYGPNDQRLKLYSNTYSPIYPGPAPALPAGLYRSRAGFIGNSIGIQLPDLYLLSAEAKARTGDITGATKHLLTLRNHRMPTTDAAAGIPADQPGLIRFIIEERRREFATLGFRWFDMRRLSTDPLFADAQYKHTVYGADGNITATYTLKPTRFVLKFSEKLLSQSPGLTDNP